VGKFLAYAVFMGVIAAAIAWHSQYGMRMPFSAAARSVEGKPDAGWLDELHSQNPREAEQAASRVAQLGERALPVLRSTLRDEHADEKRKKAALRACVLLEQRAAPVIPEVAAQLPDPALTEEAAVALSFMGRAAFAPLRTALTSSNPVVRREAMRSIGKLRGRAPLDARAVVPVLVTGMTDEDHGVRAVAATYMGIIHEHPQVSVPALMAGLDDPDIEVRRASATALGSFGEAAAPAIPALRKAASDRDEDLAREAGLSLIKLQPAGR
jgi:HEAT repeat protein